MARTWAIRPMHRSTIYVSPEPRRKFFVKQKLTKFNLKILIILTIADECSSVLIGPQVRLDRPFCADSILLCELWLLKSYTHWFCHNLLHIAGCLELALCLSQGNTRSSAVENSYGDPDVFITENGQRVIRLYPWAMHQARSMSLHFWPVSCLSSDDQLTSGVDEVNNSTLLLELQLADNMRVDFYLRQAIEFVLPFISRYLDPSFRISFFKTSVGFTSELRRDQSVEYLSTGKARGWRATLCGRWWTTSSGTPDTRFGLASTMWTMRTDGRGSPSTRPTGSETSSRRTSTCRDH